VATQGIDIDVYKVYIKDVKTFKNPTNPLLFSDGNILNLGPIPKDLPLLTGVEEMIITCIHVYLQVVHVRGQQHQYTGHIYYFS
jgi:hypothetical protein